ncbi:hypothetical protein WMY93_007724 [Mugilogobius chulae]|uniref:Acyltransferase n=1 Tax=Mugilogobius chulae TaxID=88201 RepID=A0AAW0PDU3_9GOBI
MSVRQLGAVAHGFTSFITLQQATASKDDPARLLSIPLAAQYAPSSAQHRCCAVLGFLLSGFSTPLHLPLLLLAVHSILVDQCAVCSLVVHRLRHSITRGRRVPFLCGLKLWEYMRDYFPIKLVKTSDLDPKHNYVMGFHPHGVLVAGAFTNFCVYATGFRQLFPGITSYMLMLPLWFRAPFFRDYIMCAGLIPSDKESASYPLQQRRGGTAVVIAVGGAPEALDAHPGTFNVLLAKKKGFIKMAMEQGAHLVPIFSFGENEVFDQVENSRGTWLRWTQERLQGLMGISLPLFHARGVFQYSFGLMPYRKHIHTVGEWAMLYMSQL